MRQPSETFTIKATFAYDVGDVVLLTDEREVMVTVLTYTWQRESHAAIYLVTDRDTGLMRSVTPDQITGYGPQHVPPRCATCGTPLELTPAQRVAVRQGRQVFCPPTTEETTRSACKLADDRKQWKEKRHATAAPVV